MDAYKGQVIILTHGEYSSKVIVGVFVVERDLDIGFAVKEYCFRYPKQFGKHRAHLDTFAVWLVDEGYLKEIHTDGEVSIGCYGTLGYHKGGYG